MIVALALVAVIQASGPTSHASEPCDGNAVPIANAGADIVGQPGVPVMLNGSNS